MREPTTTQRIVVGVDGSADSTAALDWALDEAHRRSASLCVVHALDVRYSRAFERAKPSCTTPSARSPWCPWTAASVRPGEASACSSDGAPTATAPAVAGSRSSPRPAGRWTPCAWSGADRPTGT